ncbi:hypothetical protein TNCV_4106731 [Trichonephila clavipes]|nr:hypothetical protein TNCV_4106731 [Trichonephila clavipes]
MEKWIAKCLRKAIVPILKSAQNMDSYRPISLTNMTYGSVEHAIKNAGAGAFLSAFSISYVGKYCDNFDGAIAAISFAINKLESCSERNIVFFIDSQAAILSSVNSKYNENKLAHSCRMKLIEHGKSRESIALQWIPSHCNISGNEKADRLVKG